ncbi:MAG: hypothetical protein A3J54_02265 [Candidatus Ryanbacteria bacterium RIFCSPHIGHO2_02_FULL_45_13b]|uniref:Rieske domain-containing protein n=1 Tax=Candidatus Ryanbacteria bacterium RIFCSPHIGHO2_02_FULL_45_13b TaxID=1802117 RepID=A0A1G2GAY1_9BACT|nr:MAG: hypothetical protein A3J54_02265 [Candidatus Ryanbacteria bacterium RIFCSPHIGHO2_02_FULL_45_13b]
MSEFTETITAQENGVNTTYHFLARVEELKKDGQLTRWIADHDILLYEHEGEVKAISNVCRHFGGPVGFHKAKGGKFTCLWHNWEYSCKNGACLSHPGLSLRTYPVKIIEQNIYINLLG